MNRQQVIAKIQSILKLQKGTDFNGEAAAAANIIDKLCKQYGVTLNEAEKTQILDEVFLKFKRINNAHASLLSAVASFYDAFVYIKTTSEGKSLQVIGSEAQQIQTRLYYEYLFGVMTKECELAHKAEKALVEITGGSVSRSFKLNFCKAFANKVALRLREMKLEENRVHEDKDAVRSKLSTMRLRKASKSQGPKGEGAMAGNAVGSTVSLNRQAKGSSQRALCGV
jgi:hypothetical protein